MLTPLILIDVCWLAFIAYWIISAFSAKKYVRRGSWGLGVRVVVILVILVIFQFSSVRDFFLREQLSVLTPTVQWLGVVVAACGVALAVWARTYLGRNWGMPMSLKKDAELVTTGPYAYVRHPIYTGMLLAMLGTTLVIIWWIVPLVFFFFYFMYAAKKRKK